MNAIRTCKVILLVGAVVVSAAEQIIDLLDRY